MAASAASRLNLSLSSRWIMLNRGASAMTRSPRWNSCKATAPSPLTPASATSNPGILASSLLETDASPPASEKSLISTGTKSRVKQRCPMGKVGYVLTFPCTCKVALFSPGYCPPITCLDVLWIDAEGFGCVALSQRPLEEIDQHNFWEMCSLRRPHL